MTKWRKKCAKLVGSGKKEQPLPSRPAPSERIKIYDLCITNCNQIEEDMFEGTSDLSLTAFNVFCATNNQVIVAGMGDVLGINHQAIHMYMQSQMTLTRLEYKTVFEHVIDIDRVSGKLRQKFKPAKTNISQPKTLTSRKKK